MSTPLPKPQDRVRVTAVMPNDPDPIPVGEQGTVTAVHPEVHQIHVDWDGGRRLILQTTDPFEVVGPTTTQHWDNALPAAIAECLADREELEAERTVAWLKEHENDDVVWTALNKLFDEFRQLATAAEE